MYQSILETIGVSPLVKIQGFKGGADIAIKLESRNPGGSIKDRPALNMIRQAEKAGLLKPGGTIVEPTSGNMGIGLAMAAAALGYKAVMVMPETMSKERQMLMKAYGTEIILTPGKGGMQASVNEAKRLSEENGWFMPNQFNNPANPQAHIQTAEEIIADLGSRKLSAFVAGVGTAGTLIGTGKGLKEAYPNLILVGAEPEKSQVLKGQAPSGHGIQGIGANFVPGNYDPSVVDRIIPVKDEDAMKTARWMARTQAMLVGISSGANLWAAMEVAKGLPEGSLVVTVAPDTGERYLSTDLYR